MNTVSDAPPIPPLILKLPQVAEVVAMSESSIERAVKEGKFPSSFRLGGTTARGWRMSDLQEWADNLPDDEGAAA